MGESKVHAASQSACAEVCPAVKPFTVSIAATRFSPSVWELKKIWNLCGPAQRACRIIKCQPVRVPPQLTGWCSSFLLPHEGRWSSPTRSPASFCALPVSPLTFASGSQNRLL